MQRKPLVSRNSVRSLDPAATLAALNASVQQTKKLSQNSSTNQSSEQSTNNIATTTTATITTTTTSTIRTNNVNSNINNNSHYPTFPSHESSLSPDVKQQLQLQSQLSNNPHEQSQTESIDREDQQSKNPNLFRRLLNQLPPASRNRDTQIDTNDCDDDHQRESIQFQDDEEFVFINRRQNNQSTIDQPSHQHQPSHQQPHQQTHLEPPPNITPVVTSDLQLTPRQTSSQSFRFGSPSNNPPSPTSSTSSLRQRREQMMKNNNRFRSFATATDSTSRSINQSHPLPINEDTMSIQSPLSEDDDELSLDCLNDEICCRKKTIVSATQDDTRTSFSTPKLSNLRVDIHSYDDDTVINIKTRQSNEQLQQQQQQSQAAINSLKQLQNSREERDRFLTQPFQQQQQQQLKEQDELLNLEVESIFEDDDCIISPRTSTLVLHDEDELHDCEEIPDETWSNTKHNAGTIATPIIKKMQECKSPQPQHHTNPLEGANVNDCTSFTYFTYCINSEDFNEDDDDDDGNIQPYQPPIQYFSAPTLLYKQPLLSSIKKNAPLTKKQLSFAPSFTILYIPRRDDLLSFPFSQPQVTIEE